jgi:lipoyl(octanoyl) transferase
MPPCQILSRPGLTSYEAALTEQQNFARQRQADLVPDTLLLLEHPTTITLGRGSHLKDLWTPREVLQAQGISVIEADRGGEISYHAPGQLVGYPILDLREHGQDLHKYLRDLEEVLIRTLGTFGITAARMPGLTCVWVDDAKIAAIGIKVTRWVSLHGFALNINLDMTPMRRDFVPCGISDKGVTSLQELCPEQTWTRERVEQEVITAFCDVFGVIPILPQAGILLL